MNNRNDGFIYSITVEASLDPGWERHFDQMKICTDRRGFTTIEGSIQDQAALHGILKMIRDLALPLVRLERRNQK